jgi:PAS domain S-box-containing protein
VGNAVAKPAARLQEHAAAVGRGEFQRRLGGEAPQELQLVADTLNRMAAQLEDRERERRRAQEDLRESEERLRLSSEAADLGVWDWDVSRNVLSWDPRCKEIMGVPPEAEPSYDLFQATLHPDDRQAAEEGVRQALASGGDYEAQYRTVGADGQMRWVLARGRVLGDSSEGPRRMLGVAMDITRRKEYEGALARAQAAEHAEQAKSEFMAMASHELHTPLNIIVGYAANEPLQSRADSPESRFELRITSPPLARTAEYVPTGPRPC